MMHSKKGFTLIELLVVIAIIGLLASVVLASLNSARDKSKDAVVKQTLSNLRTQANLYFNQNGNYGDRSTAVPLTSGNPPVLCDAAALHSIVVGQTTFFDDQTIRPLLLAAEQASGGTTAGENWINPSEFTKTFCAYQGGIGTSWAMSAPLPSLTSTTQYWCVDSTGVSKQLTAGANFGIDTSAGKYICL